MYICLTARERELIESMIAPPFDVEARIADGTGEDGTPGCTVSDEELDDLINSVAAEANHAANRKLEREWDSLFDRLCDLQRSRPSAGPDPIAAHEQWVELDNQVRWPELGGLTQAQLAVLLFVDPAGPDAPVRLGGEQVQLADLAGAGFFHNVRALLTALHERGETKSTQTGNLPRKLLADLLPRVWWRQPWIAEDLVAHGPLNERDCRPIHIARIIATLAGLMKLRKGVFSLTRKGEAMLADDRAGALHALLLRTYFHKFNLAYVDGLPEHALLARAVPFALFIIATMPAGWVPEKDVAELAYLRPFASEWAHVAPDMGRDAVRYRVIAPLVGFGLLEERRVETEGPAWNTPSEVRRTALCDAAIEIRLPPPGPPAERPRGS
jgi:hypothetical protein